MEKGKQGKVKVVSGKVLDKTGVGKLRKRKIKKGQPYVHGRPEREEVFMHQKRTTIHDFCKA